MESLAAEAVALEVWVSRRHLSQVLVNNVPTSGNMLLWRSVAKHAPFLFVLLFRLFFPLALNVAISLSGHVASS